MKIKKEILDIINSDKCITLSNMGQLKLSSMKIKNDLNLVFYIKSDDFNNAFCEERKVPLLIINENNEIVYIKKERINYPIKIIDALLEKNITDVELKNINEQESNIIDAVFNLLKENLPILDAKILESIDLEPYRESAINKHKNRQEINFPIEKRHIILTPDLVSDYLCDSKNIKPNILSLLNDYNLSRYESYVAEKECIRQYIQQINDNPELKSLNDICSIIDKDIKSFVIHYHDLKQNDKKQVFKKNVTKIKTTNKSILNHQVLDTIPIELIDKITWGNKILYDKNNYIPLNFSKEETALRCLLLNHVDFLSSENLDNKDIMTKACLIKVDNMKYLSKKLKTDKDFILNIAKNIKNETNSLINDCTDRSIYSRTNYQTKMDVFVNSSPELKSQKSFIVSYINLFNKLDYNNHTFSNHTYVKELINSLKKFISSFEFCKLIVDKVGVGAEIINIIPEQFINKKEMIDILSEKEKEHRNTQAYKKLNTVENLKSIYSDKEISDLLCFLHPNILDDRNFIYNYIGANSLQNDSIINIYKEDTDIMDKIISISNESGCALYLKYFGIKKTDSNKLFELCNKNIQFLPFLSDDDFKTFVEAELFEVESISVNNKHIILETSNCKFNIKENEIYILNKDKPEFTDITYFPYIKQRLADILKEKFKTRSKIYNSIVNEILNSRNNELEH